MDGIGLDKLYEAYNTLSNAKEKIAEHNKEYLEAIQATKGDDKEKKLATQIISKFFKHFPSLQCQAIEAIFDLCEDDEASIRMAAMKTLPTFCQEGLDFVSKIADILAQLLQLEDPQEYNVASSALLQILTNHPTIAIRCIYKQLDAPENIVREKCIKFLVTKVKNLDKAILTEKVQDVIISETKKILQDVTAEEFVNLMPFLLSTHISQTLKGQQDLLDIVAAQAEIDKPFNPLDKESNNVDRLIACVKFILPYFSAKVESTRFVSYICCAVMPEWKKVAMLKHGELLQLAILRQLAEMSSNCGKLENITNCLTNVYQLMEEYMPPPPDDADVKTMPVLNFTFVECLLYIFHRLARQEPEFITPPQKLKDFRSRLTYFSRGVQGCSKALHSFDIKNKSISDEDMKKKRISPKLLSNINSLIKDLFYQPPKYQCNVTLSFKVEEATLKKMQEKEASLKRHIPITFDGNIPSGAAGKQPRSSKPSEMKLYTPPSGKFSNNFQSYSSRARGKRGGPGRGRGSGRSWRN